MSDGRLSARRWVDYVASKPVVVLLLLVVVVHVQGRVAAVCHPFKVDSFTYSVAAYKLWQPDATAADLVPDKPPGQALLTGWCYRLLPGAATRLTLVPIESVFLLSAYGVFLLIARHLYGLRIGCVLTLFFVVAHNTYNALDFTTDGYNLNENYLALPMLAAVLAHLTIVQPARRGVASGVAIGVALMIKQTAAGLLIVLLLSELTVPPAGKRHTQRITACGMVLVGAAAICGAVALYLSSRGWLSAHVDTLLHQTASHASPPPFTLPRWYNVSPMIPACWVCALGLAAWFGRRFGHGSGVVGEQVTTAENRNPPRPKRRAAVFLAIWLLVELVILAAMRKPASHYYQQIVAPLTLLAGLGLAAFQNGVAPLGEDARGMMRRWAGATTALVLLTAAMPLFAAASSRMHTLNYREEVEAFARRIEGHAAVEDSGMTALGSRRQVCCRSFTGRGSIQSTGRKPGDMTAGSRHAALITK